MPIIFFLLTFILSALHNTEERTAIGTPIKAEDEDFNSGLIYSFNTPQVCRMHIYLSIYIYIYGSYVPYILLIALSLFPEQSLFLWHVIVEAYLGLVASTYEYGGK